MGNVLHYFAGNHTAKSFYPLYASNFQGLEHIFRLHGPSTTVKSKLIKKLGEEWKNKGFDLEWIHGSSDNDTVDGVIIPRLKVGIYGNAPHLLEQFDAEGEEVNTECILDTSYIDAKKDTITEERERTEQVVQAAHRSFKTGLSVHDGLEDIYITNMDFDKADQVAEQLITRLFADEEDAGRTPAVKHRF